MKMKLFNSVSERQATVKAVEKRRPRNADLSAPLGKRHGFAVVSEKPAITFIVSLLFWQRPLAIMSSVSKAVILSFQRMFRRRPFAHISVEVLERFHPANTDSNTSSPIIVIITMRRVVAALLHVLPRSPLRRFGQSMSCTHKKVFLSHAAAGLRLTTAQSTASGKNSAAAFTDTVPPNNILFVSLSNAYNSEKAKLLAGMVDCSRHIGHLFDYNSASIAQEFRHAH